MLVDQYGREIKSNKPIIDEVAVSSVRDRYSNYPSNGLTPQRLAVIFKEADQGNILRQAELFEEMEEKDLHLGGVLQTRKLAVTGLDWEVEAASDSAEDKKIAAAAAEMIEYIQNFEDALLDMMDAVGKGFDVQEIMWDISEGQVWIKEIKYIHQRRFTFSTPTVLLETPKLITDASPIWGEDLLPNKFVLHKYRARSGATARGGLLRPCAYMYLFKNYDIKDWLIFNELFSVPMRVGKYRPGSTPKEIEALKMAVFNMAVDAAAVISDNSVIELVESSRRGDAGVFSQLAEFCDKAMSKSVLGHTGSSESTPGKLGGETQATEVRQDLLESDSKATMKTVKFQIFAPWVMFNYGPDKAVPSFKFHFEKGEDLEKVARVYGVLVKDAGFDGIPASHIYDRFGIPQPVKGEKTLKTPQSVSPETEIPKKNISTANKIALMINAGLDPTDAWIEHYMGRLAPSLQSAREGALIEIEGWLRSLPDPPQIDVFTDHIENVLGNAAASGVSRELIQNTVTDIYEDFRKVPGANLAFGGPDIRAVNFLANTDHFYVSSYLKNSDAQSVVRNFIQDRYIEKNGGLFGRGNAADIAEFKNLLGQKAAELEGWQVRRIIDTSVQRTRNWASVTQMHEAGIEEIEIYEPTQECSFCKEMNGQVVSVSVAYSNIERQMNMSPEEYEADLRATGGELNRIAQSTNRADYVASAGMLPPYHPGCRGRAVRRVR